MSGWVGGWIEGWVSAWVDVKGKRCLAHGPSTKTTIGVIIFMSYT